MSSALPGDVVQRVRAGDASAFESLFRAYYATLCRFCTRYVGEAALAEEIVQDVFARLWVRRAEWIVRTSVRSYLFGATRNGALNLRKRQAVEEDWAAASAASDPSERPAAPRRPDEVMESADAAERVRVALETLPERCRLVMQLRWRDQLSYAEIAEVGAYLAQRLRPIDAVTMEVGLRYDRASHTGDAIFSPRFNASWQASPRTTVRAAWGTYVQSQSLFGLQAEDGVVRFAPAERAEQRVVGVEQALGRGIAARAEVYDRLVSHQRPRYVNAGSAIDMFPELSFDRVLIAPTNGRARGVELSLARDAGMRVDWSLSYVLASVTDSVQGRRVPGSLDQRHTVHADWSYHPRSNRWRLSVAGMWHSGWPYTPEAVSIDTLENSSTRLWLFNVWSPGLLYSARVPAYERCSIS